MDGPRSPSDEDATGQWTVRGERVPEDPAPVFLRQKQRERWARELLDRPDARAWPSEGSFREEATNPEAQFFRQTVDDTLLEAIEELPEWYRDAVILAYVERLSYEQISTILEIPIGTVKSRTFRGRELLRNRLSGAPRDEHPRGPSSMQRD